MTMNTNTTKAREVAELIDGIDQLRNKLGHRRSLRDGIGPKRSKEPTHRTQLQLTQAEYDAVSAIRATAGLIMGRPVGRSMAVRLGLRLAMRASLKAMEDPAAAARFKGEIMAAREERQASK